MLSVPHRAIDNKFLTSIEGYKGSLYKIGRLLAHEWWTVVDKEGKSKERYLFLFKSRILVCKVRRISDDRSIFILKDIIKLPDCEIRNTTDEKTIEINSKVNQTQTSFPLKFIAHKEDVKFKWLKEICEYANDPLALQEHQIDDLRVDSSQIHAEVEEPLFRLPHKVEAHDPNSGIRPSDVAKDHFITKQRKEEKSIKTEELITQKSQQVTLQETLQQTETQQQIVKDTLVHQKVIQQTTQREGLVEVTGKIDSKNIVQSHLEQKASEKLLEQKTGQQVEQKVEHKVEQKAEQKVEHKVEQKAEQKVEHKIEQKAEQKTDQKEEQKLEQKAAHKAEQKVETKEKQVEHKSVTGLLGEREKSPKLERSVAIESVGESLNEPTKKVEKENSNLSSSPNTHKVSTKNFTSSSEVRESKQIEAHSDVHFQSTVESNIQISSSKNIQSSENKNRITESKKSEESRVEKSNYLKKDTENSVKAERSSINVEGSLQIQSVGPEDIEECTETLPDNNRELSNEADLRAPSEGKMDDYYSSKYSSRSSRKRTELSSARDYDRASSYESSYAGSAIRRISSSRAERLSLARGEDRIGLSHTEERSSLRHSDLLKSDERSYNQAYDRRSSRGEDRASLYDDDRSIYSRIEERSSSGLGGRSSSRLEEKSIRSVEKPLITKTLKSVNIEPGENASFEVQFAEKPGVVTWMKDNKVLDDKLADRIKTTDIGFNTYRLSISHCSEKDTGTYTAKGQTGAEATTCSAQLIVGHVAAEKKDNQYELNVPHFTVLLKDTEMLEKTFFRFMVKVQGDPNPQIKFFKDGVDLEDREPRIQVIREKDYLGFYELVITEVQKQDAGHYSCEAINKHGKAVCEAEVTVVEDKNIFGSLSGQILPAGEKGDFIWKRNGEPFDPDERFKVLFGDDEDSLALVFQHVKPEDAGIYTCVAQTTTGTISCSAELSVQGSVQTLYREPEKPTLVLEHKQANSSIGGTAILELQCKGFPKPAVQFKHDGEIIEASPKYKFLYEDAEHMSLIIKDVTTEDAGEYHVTATNELGEDTTEMYLLVKSPPKIKKPSNVSCFAGETIKIEVDVEGCPQPQIKLCNNGKEIHESEHVKINKRMIGKSTEKVTIEINNTELKDAGSYSIVATNDLNQSSEFWECTIFSKPIIVKHLEKEYVHGEKEDVIMTIRVDAYPEPKVKWFQDGEEISFKDSRFQTSVDGNAYTLKISGVTRVDAAKFSVEFENEYGKVKDETKLLVKCKPEFTKKLTNLVVKEGDTDVELCLSVDGYPRPHIKWFIDGIEIEEKRKEFLRIEEGDDFKLIIKEATTALEGTYSCTIMNDYGKLENECTLTVHCKPKINKPLKDVEVNEGDTLTLEVEIHAVPDAEIKWYKDGQEVSTDARIKILRDSKRSETYCLTLNLIKTSDSGDYEVKASNALGTSTSKSKVTVLTNQIISTKKSQYVEEVLPTSQKGETDGVNQHDEKHTISHCAKINENGELITVSISTEESHQAEVTGPDESHSVHKMRSTKVILEENDDSIPTYTLIPPNKPHSGALKVEEVGSYIVAKQEENIVCYQDNTPSYGLIEESDSEKHNYIYNKGVSRNISITSASEDDLLQDMSAKDITVDEIERCVPFENGYAEIRLKTTTIEETQVLSYSPEEMYETQVSKPLQVIKENFNENNESQKGKFSEINESNDYELKPLKRNLIENEQLNAQKDDEIDFWAEKEEEVLPEKYDLKLKKQQKVEQDFIETSPSLIAKEDGEINQNLIEMDKIPDTPEEISKTELKTSDKHLPEGIPNIYT